MRRTPAARAVRGVYDGLAPRHSPPCIEIYDNILDTIGHTPLVRLNRIPKGVVAADVFAKIETFNPGNSIKDRMAVKMIEDAERDGRLKPGGTIIEGTSGNTGMGLAIAAVVKGYKCIFTTTDKQSKEKVDALRAFGAEVIVCPTDVEPEDPRSYYSVSSRLERDTPNALEGQPVRQPVQRAGALRADRARRSGSRPTARVDHLVVGVGTGGTICGVGEVPEGEEARRQGLGHRHLRVGLQEVQGDRRLRQERDLPVRHRGHRRGLPAAERRLQRHRSLREGHRPRRRDHDQPRSRARKASSPATRPGRRWPACCSCATDFKAGEVVVVIFHDHGTRYLGKMFNPDWMREKGYPRSARASPPRTSWPTGQKAPLVTIERSDTVATAAHIMTEHDYSQIPVIADGRLVGSVNEGQLFGRIVQQPGAAEGAGRGDHAAGVAVRRHLDRRRRAGRR